MATKLKEVDVVIVGLGWTGGILAKELSAAGHEGRRARARRDAQDRSGLFDAADSRRAAVRRQRYGLMQNPARDTLTFRNRQTDTALPMRRLGSFLPGEGVGGAGVHWNGVTWRWTEIDHAIRSALRAALRQEFHPGRHAAAGLAGQLPGARAVLRQVRANRRRQRQGRESPRSDPAGRQRLRRRRATATTRCRRSSRATRRWSLPKPPTKAGYHPFPRPAANASRAYTNPDGSRLGACVYCGHCERFGCEANAKGSPHITVIPIAMANPNFELRTHAWVTKVLLDSTKKKATGVMYTDVTTGEEYEQPASIVALCAYAINNVHLLLLSQHRHALRSRRRRRASSARTTAISRAAAA